MDKLGIKRITGIVIKRNRDNMYILRDNRINGNYDLLMCTGAAASLSNGDRFSLFVTAVSVKEINGIKTYTFADSTLKKDISVKYKPKFNSKEITLLLFVIKNQLDSITNNIQVQDYCIQKQFKDLKKMQQKLQEIIMLD